MNSSCVKPGDMTFATRFIATYLFLKVKGCRPMTYQHLTLRMFESAKRNYGMVDQKIFKTVKDLATTWLPHLKILVFNVDIQCVKI